MEQDTIINTTPFIKKLIHTPWIFEFFQAVRLLLNNPENKKFAVGYDHDVKQEAIRFKSIPSLRFPASEIYSVHLNLKNKTVGTVELCLSFLGLYGPSGILPNYYTELIIQRLQEKDTALRDFLDLFNHRIISLFYRSWEKQHFFAYYERKKQENALDPFTKIIAALIGNGTDRLQNRSVMSDEIFYYYAGFFARSVHSASVLKMILADYFNVPVEIEQFQGKWLSISPIERTYLTSQRNLKNAYNQLGRSALLGQHAWDTQGSFKIKIGALSYLQFRQFLPKSDKLSHLIVLTRRYVGIHFNFDVQLILKKQEVPVCALGRKLPLGWSTWLKSKSMLQDVADTCLRQSSIFLGSKNV